MSEQSITERFVQKILALNYEAAPAEAIEVSKQTVLDGLAVMHAGSREPLGVGRLSTAYVREMGGEPQASVIAGGFKTSVINAAYANGCMAHALDFDNTHYPTNHPTSPTLPAILAIAEHRRLSGKAVIEAVVTAHEVQGRFRLAATGLVTGKGFHKPSTVGMFGAAAAAAKLLRLDKQQTLMALGIAGSRAGSLSINTGTMTKSSHSGHGARMGVESAVLASMGWTASADVFGPKGFFDTFMPGDAKPELLVENFANPLRMLDPGVGFKLYPSNGFTQRPIDAALALRKEHNIRPVDIERVQITHPRFDYVNRPQPRTGLDGKFSVQYATLAALLDGDVTVDTFTNERLLANDVQALLPRVHFHADDSIPLDKANLHIIVTVWLRNGREVSKKIDNKVLGWLGSKGNPPSREQRLKKFFSCTKNVIAEKDAQRMLELVEQLETLPDVLDIMDIARCDGRRA
jgi:2-methylcitrate dehydratase PrpD